MTAKNRSGSAATKALKATVKELRTELDRADARAKQLKSKAARIKQASSDLEAQVKKLKKRNKRLKKATRPAEGQEPAVTAEASQPASTPDDSWTVVRLRAEARSRGLTGLSGKTKAQLVAALR